LLRLGGRRSECMLAVDAGRWLADNRAMSVADQARYPGSVLCRFLDSRLPLRAAVAEDWARRTASAPWTPVWLDVSESRQRVGLAAEMRIGLDLGEAPAYFDLLSFLPSAEFGALLDAAGFNADDSLVAVTGTADPLLLDRRRVQQPVRLRRRPAGCPGRVPRGGGDEERLVLVQRQARPGAPLVPGAVPF
jgi:hypothetical protein